MAHMKFAFIFLRPSASHSEYSFFKKTTMKTCMAASIEQACLLAQDLVSEGYNLIELCGDFEEAGALKVSQAVNNQAVVGYVVRSPEQDELFKKMFES